MSFSVGQKLRSMGGKFEMLRVGELPPPTIELLFWPQIVALVEAAENVYAVGPWSEERLGRLDDLAAALGALDEALQ